MRQALTNATARYGTGVNNRKNLKPITLAEIGGYRGETAARYGQRDIDRAGQARSRVEQGSTDLTPDAPLGMITERALTIPTLHGFNVEPILRSF